MVPPICSILVFTTSMPTPRPDTAVTVGGGGEAGAEDEALQSAPSVMPASSASVARPCASTLARILSTGRPRPSSAISMMMWPPSWNAFSVMRPVSGLPAARRSAGFSRPWSPELRTMWVSGSLISSSTWRSSSVSAPSMTSSIFLSISRARSRTSRGSLFQALPIGCMRVFITPSCRSEVMCDSRCSGAAKPLSSSGGQAAEAGCASAPAR